MGTSRVFGSGIESRVGARLKTGILDKQNVNVCLIDFIYFLRMLPPQMPATFGEVATFIIKYACLHADTVHIICDAYSNEPTIKDFKCDRRGNVEATYTIHGCNPTRPTDFNRALLSTSFKSALINFLAYEIRLQHYKDIINEKTVFFAWKQSCIKVQVDNNEVIISGVLIKNEEHLHTLLDWVSQTLSPQECLSPWSATFELSMVSPIHQMTNHWRK